MDRLKETLARIWQKGSFLGDLVEIADKKFTVFGFRQILAEQYIIDPDMLNLLVHVNILGICKRKACCKVSIWR